MAAFGGYLPVPFCDLAADGDTCIWDSPAGKGYVAIQSYSTCARRSLLLPGFELLPDWALVVAYGLTLAWSFFGVAIISDVFMSAIDVIVCAERTVTRTVSEEEIDEIEAVWSPTVANVMLVTLGTSAPVILLAIVETCTTLGELPGSLGPYSIVGSAAYSLFVVPAVCIVAVPEQEHRKILDYGVYAMTAGWALWAYAWLLLVYEFWTPGEVTPMEAWLTLLMFPMLVASAYKMEGRHVQDSKAEEDDGLDQVVVGSSLRSQSDRPSLLSPDQPFSDMDKMQHVEMTNTQGSGLIGASSSAAAYQQTVSWDARSDANHDATHTVSAMDFDTSTHGKERMSDPTQADMIKAMLKIHLEKGGSDINAAIKGVAAELAEMRARENNPMTALQYKMNARRALTGKKSFARGSLAKLGLLDDTGAPVEPPLATLSFRSEHYAVGEDQQSVIVMVNCFRSPQARALPISCRFTTEDGEAEGGSDYETTHGSLHFPPGVDCQPISVRIFNDDDVEDDERFFIKIYDADPPRVEFRLDRVRLCNTCVEEAFCR